MTAKATALATIDQAPPPVPMFGARAMGDAFAAYQQLLPVKLRGDLKA